MVAEEKGTGGKRGWIYLVALFLNKSVRFSINCS